MRTAEDERADVLAYLASIHDSAGEMCAEPGVARIIQAVQRTNIGRIAHGAHVGSRERIPEALPAILKAEGVDSLTKDEALS